MAERNYNFPIGNDKFFPRIHVRICKDKTFLYWIGLSILLKEETIQLCYCDNYNDHGDHIHYSKRNGETIRRSLEIGNIGKINKIADFIQENWKKILEEYLKNGN